MSHLENREAVQPAKLDVEQAVRDRYSAASRAPEPALCCPVQYQAEYLRVLPPELIERDYGCGDPSPHVAAGETVLDLGSGGGKICYIASQIVGAAGRVLGVDMNDDMLALARKYRQEIGTRIGWHNVEFYKGRIQDLALDMEKFSAYLSAHPVRSAHDWLAAEKYAEQLRQREPMIASNSMDVVVSNCVLNLVSPQDRRQLFAEIFRVLRPGGRAVISDIVCDEQVPEALQHNAQLWSGCLSGAFVEHEFLGAFEQAGFHGLEILARQETPWAVVEGIEFRSLTLRAYKRQAGFNLDCQQAVVYKGPWKSVTDDEGQVLLRGERMAVSERTFQLYGAEPYAGHVFPIAPPTPVAPAAAQPWNRPGGTRRDPRESKGVNFTNTQLPQAACCGPGECK